MARNYNKSGSIFEIITYQGIVLFHLNRCVINGSVEWHGGYWTESPQSLEKIYIQNSREVFSNSVKMLKALLVPHFDDIMETNNKKVNIKLKKLYEKFNKKNKEEYSKEDYLNDRIKVYIYLFEKLNGLLKRRNYMEADVYGDADVVEDKENDTTNKSIGDVSDFEDNDEDFEIEKDNNVSIEEPKKDKNKKDELDKEIEKFEKKDENKK